MTAPCPNCGCPDRDGMYCYPHSSGTDGLIPGRTCAHAAAARKTLKDIATSEKMTVDSLKDWAQDGLRTD